MKRILALGLLALGFTLASQQQASAWCNFKFGAGVNWNYQSGNNCWFWGLCKSGEVPGPEYFGCCPPGCGGDAFGGHGPLPAYAGGPTQYYGPSGAYAYGPQQQTPAAATGNTAPKTPAATIPNYQPSSVPFQPTSYQSGYQGAYPSGYQYNPYWSNSYYGGGYYPAYNGWNWNYGY